MVDSKHFESRAYQKGVFYKYDGGTYRRTCKGDTRAKAMPEERQGCGRGYHGNRWEAHHILPGVVFSNLDANKDKFFLDCLKLSDFNINEKYSLGGMPKLTAFILYFQKDHPHNEALETHVTMKRWSHVKQYASEIDVPITFPGDIPAHTPVNWGHTEYNKEVEDYLRAQVFEPCRDQEHPKPVAIHEQLKKSANLFWQVLNRRGRRVGGGGRRGVESNLLNRHGKDSEGWWVPLCMSRNPERPTSPGQK